VSDVFASERLATTDLDEAVARVGQGDLGDSLQEVARHLPVPIGVETVAIRVRDADAEGQLHLAATEGIPPGDRRNPLFYTQTIAQARSMFALKSRHSLARTLGFTWLEGEWIRSGSEPVGTITVGSRTERRPTPRQAALLRDIATHLGTRMSAADRRARTLVAISRRVARESLSVPLDAPARVASVLRPRELTVLALYTDGLSAVEIADVFVVSPHTVRTHIKNAYRRLGVHSREEAARLMRAERLIELV
jgi:DNA-binding CsgD family transcriptional regulator